MAGACDGASGSGVRMSRSDGPSNETSRAIRPTSSSSPRAVASSRVHSAASGRPSPAARTAPSSSGLAKASMRTTPGTASGRGPAAFHADVARTGLPPALTKSPMSTDLASVLYWAGWSSLGPYPSARMTGTSTVGGASTRADCSTAERSARRLGGGADNSSAVRWLGGSTWVGDVWQTTSTTIRRARPSVAAGSAAGSVGGTS